MVTAAGLETREERVWDALRTIADPEIPTDSPPEAV